MTKADLDYYLTRLENLAVAIYSGERALEDKDLVKDTELRATIIKLQNRSTIESGEIRGRIAYLLTLTE